MVSVRFAFGVILVYAGFLLFFVGFMNNAMTVPAFGQLAQTLMPVDITAPLRGSIMQLAGGFLTVTGILICLVSRPAAPSVIIQRAPDVQPQQVAPNAPATTTPIQAKCRFCGTPMRSEDVFCPACNRSQT